jgi:hypothetical protein
MLGSQSRRQEDSLSLDRYVTWFQTITFSDGNEAGRRRPLFHLLTCSIFSPAPRAKKSGRRVLKCAQKTGLDHQGRVANETRTVVEGCGGQRRMPSRPSTNRMESLGKVAGLGRSAIRSGTTHP